MKRILCLLLCLVMTLGIFAGCTKADESGNDQAAAPATFSVGYGKADISPEHSVYLCGYGDPVEERMSTTVCERLYANCVAFTDSKGETVIFIATDLLLAYETWTTPIRQMVSSETGVPIDNVMFHCTHNHSGPSANHDTRYRQLLTERCLEAAKTAMADRKPAQMYTTFTRPEKVNTVRHYLLADGNFQGEAVGSVAKNQLIGHYTNPDNLLQLVKFTREGGKDIILINWQGHPRGTTPNPHTAATSNYPGVMRTTIEEGLDCEALFVLSGSGNMNNNSQIPGEVLYDNYIELGQGLGQTAIEAAANFKPANTGDIQITKSYVNKAGQEDTSGAPLYAFSIGDLAFATAPFEIFHTNAQAVKENSKYPMTFYASCSNESHGYLPTPPSFDWEQHYEVRITNYPKGTAESVQAILSGLLDDIFEASGNVEVPKEEGYIQPAFEPFTDGKTYLNLTPGDLTQCTEVANNFWKLALMDGSTVRTFLAVDEATAKKVLEQTNVKLMFNEQNVIVDIVTE